MMNPINEKVIASTIVASLMTRTLPPLISMATVFTNAEDGREKNKLGLM